MMFCGSHLVPGEKDLAKTSLSAIAVVNPTLISRR